MTVDELYNMRGYIYSSNSNVQLDWAYIIKLFQFDIFRQVKLLQQFEQMTFKTVYLYEVGHYNTLPYSISPQWILF
jgi:hypothetical protein